MHKIYAGRRKTYSLRDDGNVLLRFKDAVTGVGVD